MYKKNEAYATLLFTMWTAKLQHADRTKDENEGYKGIPIFAGYKLHETSYTVLTKYLSNPQARILVLGAGAGAFDQRLIDNGYTNILAVEYHKELYRPKAEVISRDLNQDFNNLGTFDVVIAIEIIEHLENHFHFVRQIKDLLNDDGIALITTPNVESPISRIKFFLRGDLSCFTKSEILHTGHINPIFKNIFVTHLASAGMYVREIAYSTSLWDMKQFSGFSQKIFMIVFRCMTLFMRNATGGQLSIFVIAKK
jgi:SAM-dependent methyltransferase